MGFKSAVCAAVAPCSCALRICPLPHIGPRAACRFISLLASLRLSRYVIGIPAKEFAVCSKDLWCYRLASLQERHCRQQADLTRVADELASTRAEHESLEMEQPVLAQKFRYYQELRGYVTDLVECLDEKVGSYISITTRGALGGLDSW